MAIITIPLADGVGPDGNASPATQFADDFDNGLFMFDPERHDFVNHRITDLTEHLPAQSFEEFDAMARLSPDSAIIIGQISGPSLNRSMHLSVSHVLTPFAIQDVIFVGDNVADVFDISPGASVDIMEGYSFVMPNTQEALLGEFDIGTAVTIFDLLPMEVGNIYLLYLHILDHEQYLHNDRPLLSAAHRLAVYKLYPTDPIRAQAVGAPHYDWWQDAMQMYGHMVRP